jgi:demethylmenaquinone methyltransferase/2-methoxy-6-polyprenyl-1,4-benzoquinol methylase
MKTKVEDTICNHHKNQNIYTKRFNSRLMRLSPTNIQTYKHIYLLTMPPIAIIVGVVLIAFVSHRYMFQGIEAPPPSFGSGSMFDLIAARYDRINRVLALGLDIGWRKTMVAKVAESVRNIPSPMLLDVATGTADVAILLAQELPKAQVTGVDPSNNMLAIGRQKIKNAKVDHLVHLQTADAQELMSLSENTFHAATMAFGIRNVPDRSRAFCQIHKVLRNNSRFCILEFSEPSDDFGFMGAAARLFIRSVVPFLGGILSGKPREYWHLQNSIQEFPSPQVFSKQLEAVECPTGKFRMEELQQMNFGSVQLYIARTERIQA